MQVWRDRWRLPHLHPRDGWSVWKRTGRSGFEPGSERNSNVVTLQLWNKIFSFAEGNAAKQLLQPASDRWGPIEIESSILASSPGTWLYICARKNMLTQSYETIAFLYPPKRGIIGSLIRIIYCRCNGIPPTLSIAQWVTQKKVLLYNTANAESRGISLKYCAIFPPCVRSRKRQLAKLFWRDTDGGRGSFFF